MTDLEMTKLCAEAMGIKIVCMDERGFTTARETKIVEVALADNPMVQWHPLHDDAQAMALVKKFKPLIEGTEKGWWVACTAPWDTAPQCVENADLNRAIVECVAKMQKEKGERK